MPSGCSRRRSGVSPTAPPITISPWYVSRIVSTRAPGGPTTALPPRPKLGSRLPSGSSRATTIRVGAPGRRGTRVAATNTRSSRNTPIPAPPSGAVPCSGTAATPLALKLRSRAPSRRSRTTSRRPLASGPVRTIRPSRPAVIACARTSADRVVLPSPEKLRSKSPGRAEAGAARSAKARAARSSLRRSPPGRRDRRRSRPPPSASARPARRAPRAPPAWPWRCPRCRRRSRRRGPSSCRAAP